MSLPHTAAEVLRKHVTLELECMDRLYLNVYVPLLQSEGGAASFFRVHRGHKFASTALMAPMTKDFVGRIESFVQTQGLDLVSFEKGKRKDALAAQYLHNFSGNEGVLFVGKAQEKAWVFRSQRRRNPQTGKSYAWLARTTVMVNYYYFYCVDRDFGPFFIKFCSYFPYTAKMCINGHEYLKRQLDKHDIGYQALGNGVLSCQAPAQLASLARELTPEKIDQLLRKWLARLPHPFTPADRGAGYRYELSIVQAEFSLTQVLERPVMGRILFEQIIRENLDLGRPSHVQLIFNRRVTRRTPGRFRTRIVTDGVIPSLHIDYKKSHIKQYHKEARALRTETTVNDPRDFGLCKGLSNLPALQQIGFHANRRLLDVQQLSHDCTLGEDAFAKIDKPIWHQGQRAPSLRFADPRVQALMSTLLLFIFLPRGFSNADLRPHLAQLLGMPTSTMTQGRMSYDLRRLRLHGLIERIPHTHRYHMTSEGIRTAMFFTRTYARILRTGLSHIAPVAPAANSVLPKLFDRLEKAVDQLCDDALIAA